MNRTTLSRIGASALIAIAVAFAGCDAKPLFDPKLQYSAETLAQEFVYAYGELKTANGSAIRSDLPKERPEAVAKEATKGAPATKNAQPLSLDELIAQTIRKAGSVTGMSKADACKRVIEEAQKSPSIPDVDKKTIAEKLGNVSN